MSNKNNCTYRVYREKFNVFYDVMRNDDIISTKSLCIFDLLFFQYMSLCFGGIDSERSVKMLFILAHKKGKKAVLNLQKYET